MKPLLRFLLPISAALIIGIGLLAFLLLQLHNGLNPQGATAKKNFGALTADLTNTGMEEVLPVTTGDAALLHLREGDLRALAGDWKGAQKEYQASVDAGGGIPALKKLAVSQLQRRQNDDAETTVERLKQEGGRAEDILLLSTSLLLHKGELEQAKQQLTDAGESPQKHYGLVLIAIIQGNHDEAKTQLQQVAAGWDPVLRAYAGFLQDSYDRFALFPESTDAYLSTLLASSLAKVQECEIALPLLAEVTKKQDDYRDAWTVAGYCNLVTERYDQALSALERAYTLDPEKPQIQYFLGRTYAALEDHKNAITFLQYALQNGFQPEKEVRRALAEQAQLDGNVSLAFEQDFALATASGADIGSIETFVKAALQMDKKPEALDVAQRMVARWPESAKAYDILGWAQAAAGQKEQAKMSYEKALQLDATMEDAKQNLLNLGAVR